MAWQLWDRIRAFTREARIYRTDNIFQDQSDLSRIISSGEFIDFSRQGALLQQTNLQINRLERYKDFDQMDEVGEISLALDLYADEASLTDPERKHVITIRAKDSAVKEELEDLFYNVLLIDNRLRPMIRYLCKYGDAPFEILTTEDRDAVAGLKFLNIYNFSRVETRHGDLVGFFFQDELAIEPIFLHPWQVMHLRLTSFENIYNPYGRCEKFGTRILTPSGYRNIEDFEPGDDVYVFDDNQLIQTRVIAACHSGEKEILRIRTRHYENNCSENHPILVRIWENRNTKFGDKWFASLAYKRADELEFGDEIVIPKSPEFIDYVNLGQIRDRDIIANEQFTGMFGFLIGDGWLIRVEGKLIGVEFALGEHEEINDCYEGLLTEYSSNKAIRCANTNAVKTYSKEFAEFLESCGFIQGSHKRIPDWVFRSPKPVKIAFIEGLIDAGGSTHGDEWDCERIRLELSNYELIKDVKMLLHDIGWRCGNIMERVRGTDTTVHDIEYKCEPSWIIYFFRSELFITPEYNFGYGPNTRKEEHEKFGSNVRFEKVVSIERTGKSPTADIQVDHPASNFIADGIVVHNSIIDGSRKSFKQLRLMEDAAVIYRITRAPERRVFTIPVGNIAPKQIPGFIELIARRFKKRRFFDPASGDVSSRYDPLIQEDDYWLPRRPDGTGPTVDTLPGAQNLDEIADIEYFKKKMIAGTKVPFSRAGIGEQAESDRSLAASSPEFAKAVQFVQREGAIGLKKIAIVHLALKGFRDEQIRDFDIAMTASSAIDELYRIETWSSRVDVIGGLKEIGWFPPKWVLTRFTDMTEDEIEMMLGEMKEKEVEDEFGGGGGGLGGLGSGLDLGGGPELDLGELGEEPEGELEGLEGLEEEPAPGEERPGLEFPEGYNIEVEKRVIMELARYVNRKKIVYRRPRDNEINSNVDFMLNEGELDGLKISENEIVESIIPEDIRNSVINENKALLMAADIGSSSDSDDEIMDEEVMKITASSEE